MKLGAALRLVSTDLGALFPRGEAGKYWFLLLASLALQAAFWYVATPGPSLLHLAPQTPLSAFNSVAWSVLLLLFIPAALYRALLMVLVSGDPTLAATYPWPGSWAGTSLLSLAIWLVVYSLYYLAFEAFYRGFVIDVARRVVSPTAAIWLSVVMATLIHLGKPLAEVMAAAPVSVLFAVLAVRSRSILYPMLLHLTFGFALDLAVLARSGHLLN